MEFVHQSSRSEWDDAHTNHKMTPQDSAGAIIILGVFALIALIV